MLAPSEADLPPYTLKHDGPGRTYDDPGGPMVEPEHPAWIDEMVREYLAGFTTPRARAVLAYQGRRVSDRMAARWAHEQTLIEDYQVAAAEFARHLRVGPAVGAMPRITPVRDPRTHEFLPRTDLAAGRRRRRRTGGMA